jgi:hypothetical protein
VHWHTYLPENESKVSVCVCLAIIFQEAQLRQQAGQLRLEKEAALDKLQSAQQDRDMEADVSALTFLVLAFPKGIVCPVMRCDALSVSLCLVLCGIRWICRTYKQTCSSLRWTYGSYSFDRPGSRRPFARWAGYFAEPCIHTPCKTRHTHDLQKCAHTMTSYRVDDCGAGPPRGQGAQ